MWRGDTMRSRILRVAIISLVTRHAMRRPSDTPRRSAGWTRTGTARCTHGDSRSKKRALFAKERRFSRVHTRVSRADNEACTERGNTRFGVRAISFRVAAREPLPHNSSATLWHCSGDGGISRSPIFAKRARRDARTANSERERKVETGDGTADWTKNIFTRLARSLTFPSRKEVITHGEETQS